jgi:hypothetical protein
VPTRISLLSSIDKDMIMLALISFFKIVHLYNCSKFYPQTIIFPVLSPETKVCLSLFPVGHKADTDPVCPDTALIHLSPSQKYIDPFVIPLSIQLHFAFL